ncbi:LexA family protein [Levyella massiliensis]|uniref:LexA family protein n=1 Tax=Levyella massiliensis TaxID=938289 RepID=UPI0024AE5032|nr:S24 family peptidase [Levyella massiliensis]
MKKSNTSKRLKEIMRTRGMRQVDILNTIKPIAEATGVRFEKNDLSQYVSGKVEPSQPKLTVLSKALGVSETWLMGYDDLDAIINRHPDLHPIRKIRSVPILGTIACGTPIWAEENFEGYVGIDPMHMDGEFALICKGDSMVDAEIHDGDLVLMKKVPDVEDGEIAAVLIDNEATLKRVYKKENLLVLQPCNRNYSPIVYSYDEAEDNGIQIIGECVGVYHPKKR